MSPSAFLSLALLSSLSAVTATPPYDKNATYDGVKVHWLGGSPPTHNFGTTFGLPWPRSTYYSNTTRFSIDGETQLQSWPTAFWPDGSLKWTAHAIAGSESPPEELVLSLSGAHNHTRGGSTPEKHENRAAHSSKLTVTDFGDEVQVDTGKIVASFPKEGNVVLSELSTAAGRTVGQNGKLVLHSTSAVEDNIVDRADASPTNFNFESSIDNVIVSNDNSVRALVTVRGVHQLTSNGEHPDWLPFVLRFYLYANSEAIRLVHTIIYDGDAQNDFITGIGVRFSVPLKDEKLYDRHVRIAGEEGGLLSESVLGITGLRRDPGEEIRQAQFEGAELPALDEWDERVSTRLHWIPTWSDFSLTQLSPDGFTLKKRTEPGQGWVTIPGATRAGGLAYLGGATQGGLALGLRDFWKRHPTGLDVRKAADDNGQLTLWIYSPEAQPLDLRPYHDGLGQETWEDQLDALEVTYEDWEEGFDTPYGIARTNEIFLFGFDSTPSRDKLSELSQHVNSPPVLVADPEHIHHTGAVGTYWSLPDDSAFPDLESNLDFLLAFYQNQTAQRRWYGFLDHGDVMHTYDEDRHQWRYDIGGYAWDNSELSPDLFLWLQFLRTGREDVYRFSEAMTKHTGEVDVYHLGPLKGLGTRHGVQHYSDSAKQVRISNAQFRKYFYYLSGGDERTSELIDETLDADQTFRNLDPNRKVRGDDFLPSPNAVDIGLGTDFSALAASWLLEWERRGPRWEEAVSKLTNVANGIANLTNGFVSGSGIYDPADGTLSPPPGDPENRGYVAVSHLSAMFGLLEVMAELTDHWGRDMPVGFEDAWLDYCYYYNAPNEEQEARYGEDFGPPNQVQSHSRLTAYAAQKQGNSSLAERAWKEYLFDGLGPNNTWTTERVGGADVLAAIDEASWVSTNEFAQYGLATIQNVALVGRLWQNGA